MECQWGMQLVGHGNLKLWERGWITNQLLLIITHELAAGMCNYSHRCERCHPVEGRVGRGQGAALQNTDICREAGSFQERNQRRNRELGQRWTSRVLCWNNGDKYSWEIKLDAEWKEPSGSGSYLGIHDLGGSGLVGVVGIAVKMKRAGEWCHVSWWDSSVFNSWDTWMRREDKTCGHSWRGMED